MSNQERVHPAPEQLLRHLDGELSAREAEQVRVHLDACWECRAEREEFQKTATECVRFRQMAAAASPAPPRPWFDIRREIEKLDATGQPSLAGRIAGWFVPAAASWRLAPTAMALVAAGWMVYSLRFAPSAQAAMLLDRAVAAGRAKAIQPRKVEIRRGSKKFTRLVAPKAVPAAMAMAGEDQELMALFGAAHYDWNDPLSARSFQEWRGGLASKSDQIAETAQFYEIRTTTDASDLTSAALTLASADMHPTRAAFQFRNQERVEIVEVPVDGAGPAVIASQPASPANPVPALPAPAGNPLENTTPSAPVSLPATASDELQVVLRLHRAGADLGEPVEIARSGEAVRVRGIGLDADRQQQIKAALAGLPRVEVDFSETGVSGWTAPTPTQGVTVTGEASAVQARIEAAAGGRSAFERLSAKVLETSDRAMARAHALRRLAAQFPASVETGLPADERQALAALRTEHAAAMDREAAAILDSLSPVLTSMGGRDLGSDAQSSGAWQRDTQQLFDSARAIERQTGIALGGAASTGDTSGLPSQLLTEVTRLRNLLKSYR